MARGARPCGPRCGSQPVASRTTSANALYASDARALMLVLRFLAQPMSAHEDRQPAKHRLLHAISFAATFMSSTEHQRSDDEIYRLRHSTTHVLANALLDLFPHAKVA